MKKSLIGALAAAAALGTGFASFTGPALAETPCAAKYQDTCYATVKDAVIAVSAGGTVVLAEDSQSTENIPSDKTFTLDLAGHTYSSSNKDFTLAPYAASSTITVKDSVGGGKLTNTGKGYPVALAHGGTFILESGTVAAKNGATAAAIYTYVGSDAADGAHVIINGGSVEGYLYGITVLDYNTLVVNDGLVAAAGTCILNNGSQTGPSTITINGGHIEQVDKDQPAIFHPGVGTVNIYGGEITGGSGIEMRAGTLNVSGGSITGHDTLTKMEANGNGASVKKGAAIGISQHTTKKPISVNISGGYFGAYYPLYEANLQNNPAVDIAKISISVTGGEFEALNADGAVVRTQDLFGFVRGGSFALAENEDPADFIYPYIDFSKSYSYDEATRTVSVHDMVQVEELPAGYSVEMAHLDFSDMPAESKQGFATYLSNYLEIPAGFTVVQQEDITLLGSDGDPVKDIVEPITFHIRVEESSRVIPEGVTRKWYVVRSHYEDSGSTPTFSFVEASYDAAEGIVTFATDRFSGFIIAYVDTELPKVPDTSLTDELTASYIALGSLIAISAAAFVAVKARR